jgi:hypothetical protein
MMPASTPISSFSIGAMVAKETARDQMANQAVAAADLALLDLVGSWSPVRARRSAFRRRGAELSARPLLATPVIP